MHRYGMEERGWIARRGFWPLALLWLPAGVAAQAAVRFLPNAGLPGDPHFWPAALTAAGSLVLVAPCGLPLPAPDPIRGARLPPALALAPSARGLDCRDRSGRGNRRRIAGGGAAGTGRDRNLSGRAQPARMDRLVVAGAARLTAESVGPAAQQWAIEGNSR